MIKLPTTRMYFGSLFLVTAMAHAQTEKLAPYELTVPGTAVKIKMIPVQGGTIKVGGKDVVVKPYYLAESETPWEAFDAYLKSGPASKPYDQTKFAPDAIARPSKSYILPDMGWGHHGYPVLNVSSTSVTMFCRWMSAETKKKVRLPSDAEWEMAYRAGESGDMKMDQKTVDSMGWTAATSDDLTHPIKKKKPNAWGFYDMIGNVGEWAIDQAGEFVLCGATFRDKLSDVLPSRRQYYSPAWQEEDPQIPKSRWWLSDGNFVGFRFVVEP